jgi:hypothetical protein
LISVIFPVPFRVLKARSSFKLKLSNMWLFRYLLQKY